MCVLVHHIRHWTIRYHMCKFTLLDGATSGVHYFDESFRYKVGGYTKAYTHNWGYGQHTNKHTYIRTYRNAWRSSYIHTYVHTFECACPHSLTRMHTHGHQYTRIRTHEDTHASTQLLVSEYVYIHTYVRTYECTSHRLCILTRTNTHTHTHTHAPDDRSMFHDDVDCFISVYNRNLHSVVPSRCFRLFGRLKTETEKGVEGWKSVFALQRECLWRWYRWG